MAKEIRVLESGLYTSDSTSSLPTPRTHATTSFLTAIKGGCHATSVKKKPQCIYCKSEHSPTTCTEVPDHQKQLDIVRKANLCFNCLGNHKVSQCNSKFRCKHCRHQHHTSLCKPSDSETPRPSAQNTGTQATDTQAQQLTQQLTQQVGVTRPQFYRVYPITRRL